MAGVFLSYARFDSELGERIVAGLRALDVECWWDRDMPGVDWPREIERQIDTMSALVVIWTAASKDSKYVRAEAIPAFDREKLVNIMFGVKEPPLPFNLYNGFQLDDWTGREPHDGWTRLVRTLEAKLVGAGEVKQGQLVAALGRREQEVRRRGAALTAAQGAFAAAQTGDTGAGARLDEAKAALARAEEQLSQLSAMHAGPNVIRGAQADLDEARAGLTDAQSARRAAADGLAGAATALARAKTAVETAYVCPPALPSEPSLEPDAGAAQAGAAEPDDPPSVPAAQPAGVTAPAVPAPDPRPTASPAAGRAAPLAGGAAAGAKLAASQAGGASGAAGSAGGGAPGGATGGGTGSAAAAAPKSSPMPLLVGGGAVLVAGVLLLALFGGGRHPRPPASETTPAADANATSAANAADASPANAAPANAAPAPADPAIAAMQAMAGDWGGNGAVCGANPLTITADPLARMIRETLSNTPSEGVAMDLNSDGALKLVFMGDGHTEYDRVSGDTLTVKFSSGSMTYQRCKT